MYEIWMPHPKCQSKHIILGEYCCSSDRSWLMGDLEHYTKSAPIIGYSISIKLEIRRHCVKSTYDVTACCCCWSSKLLLLTVSVKLRMNFFFEPQSFWRNELSEEWAIVCSERICASRIRNSWLILEPNSDVWHTTWEIRLVNNKECFKHSIRTSF